MNRSLLQLALMLMSLVSLTSVQAKDLNPANYEAVLTGMVCGACRVHVTHAVEQLPNAKEIKIKRGPKEGTQLVSFRSSDESLSKEHLVKALGEDGKQYQVLSLEKK